MSTAEYGPAVLRAGVDLGISPKGIVIGFATVFVESNWTMYANSKVPASMSIPHEAVGSDGFSVGLFQQQVVGPPWWWGDAATCMDPYKSAQLFFIRLAKIAYNDGANSPGSYAQAIQQSAFPDRYDERMADAQALYDQLVSGGAPVTPVTDPNRPDFNEFPKWCANNQGRTGGGTDVDLWLLHTQEGGGGNSAAEDLANFLISTENGANPVSYHYTGSQASDGGVTIVDVVDTDDASWSVGNSNDRSINFCFAGSATSWSRDQWIKQAKVIDVAAYLFVQDCKKYPKLQARVIAPNYSAPPGAADHKYCTEFLKDGNNHTDVGPNFPWDVFTAAVKKYADLDVPPPTQPPDAPPADPFEAWMAAATDRDLLEYIVEQLGPGDPTWASKGATLRDFLWSLQSQAKQTAAKAAAKTLKRADRKAR
jgi:hypothetical protein